MRSRSPGRGLASALILLGSLGAGGAQQVSLRVTTTLDAGPGSLRQAILEANAAGAPVVIRFAIPAGDGGFVDADAALPGGDPDPDVFVIRPRSPLPPLNNPNAGITLDGASQAAFGGDSNPFGPEIVLEGSQAGEGAGGLRLESDNHRVAGLNIQGFAAEGLSLMGGDNRVEDSYIGTDPTGTRARGNGQFGVWVVNAVGSTIANNVIAGNGWDGIRIWGTNAQGSQVSGNHIGADRQGTTALANGWNGVTMHGQASGNLIGGIAPGMRNLISGNAHHGVVIDEEGTQDNQVLGNYIGTDVSGTRALGNGGQAGGAIPAAVVQLRASNNTLRGNLVSGNFGDGISIGSGAFSNRVEGNFIGTAVTGAKDVGNSGHGVAVWGEETTGNAILSNTISANGGLGIDLGMDGPTDNDEGDLDGGPNRLQNFPVLTGLSDEGAVVEGHLDSAPATVYLLQFFLVGEPDPSGYGEGESLLGSASVTTDASGRADFAVRLQIAAPEGHSVTATATDPENNTSEFSRAYPGHGPPPVGSLYLHPPNLHLVAGATSGVPLVAMDDEGNRFSAGLVFESYDRSLIAISEDGYVTALRAESDAEIGTWVQARLSGQPVASAAIVRVLSRSYDIPFHRVQGARTVLYYPSLVHGEDLSVYVDRYEMPTVSEYAYLVQSQFMGLQPFDGARQIIEVDFGDSETQRVCGISGNPIRLGWNLEGNEWSNCFLVPFIPPRSPQWNVMYHELGHNFTWASPSFGPGLGLFHYSEGLATALSAATLETLLADPARYPMGSDATVSLQGQLSAVTGDMLSALQRWQGRDAPFSEMSPDIVDGIWFHFQQQRGQDFARRFFLPLQPQFYARLSPLLNNLDEAGQHTVFAALISAAVGRDLSLPFAQDYHYPVDSALFASAYGAFREILADTLPPGPDADGNGEVDDFELLDHIDRWARGEVDDFDLLGAIDWWATGPRPR